LRAFGRYRPDLVYPSRCPLFCQQFLTGITTLSVLLLALQGGLWQDELRSLGRAGGWAGGS